MTEAERENLKSLAQAATQGPWKQNGPDVDMPDGEHYTVCGSFSCTAKGDAQDVVNASYVAAAHPGAVLELIGENERLGAALTWIEQHAYACRTFGDDANPLDGLVLVARALSAGGS